MGQLLTPLRCALSEVGHSLVCTMNLDHQSTQLAPGVLSAAFLAILRTSRLELRQPQGGGGATGACLMVSARVATRATSGVTRGPPPSFSTWIYAKPEWTSTNSDILYWYGLLINSHGALLAGPFSISANCNALFRRSYKDADSRPAQGMHPWVRIWRVFLCLAFFYIRVNSYRENSRKQKKMKMTRYIAYFLFTSQGFGRFHWIEMKRLVFFFFIFIRTKFEVLKEGHKWTIEWSIVWKNMYKETARSWNQKTKIPALLYSKLQLYICDPFDAGTGQPLCLTALVNIMIN
jgi:hypothetical protein